MKSARRPHDAEARRQRVIGLLLRDARVAAGTDEARRAFAAIDHRPMPGILFNIRNEWGS